MISLDKCNESCKILIETYGKICVPNKTENTKLSVFNLITRENKSKNLT